MISIRTVLYGGTTLCFLAVSYGYVRVSNEMEGYLDWGTTGKSVVERAFREVAREFGRRNPEHELLKRYRLYVRLGIFFISMLVIEVLALQ